jgi:predicted TIM-barrel fold metal-dependent hydrolase
MPARAVDCHAHVFDTKRFPYPEHAAYKPPPHEAGTWKDYAAVLDAQGISHALLVNPTSGYGTDHRAMMAAIRAGKGRFRGIAKLTPASEERSFVAMARQGVVGARIDLVGDGADIVNHPNLARRFALMRELGWFLQVQCEKDQMAEAAAALRATGLHMLVDHCGRPEPKAGLKQKGFQAVLELGRDGRATVKLSGAFRFAHRPYPYEDADPYVAALLGAFGTGGCIWGSDWPFLRPGQRVDYGPILALLKCWLPDARDRQAVLWRTPARLFGFKS